MGRPASQRVLCVLTAAMMVAACDARVSVVGQARALATSGGYSLSEHFNDTAVGRTPAGWSTDTSAGTVEVAALPDNVDRSLKITKTVGAGNVTATNQFERLRGVVRVEARVRVDLASGQVDVLRIAGADGAEAVQITVRDGRFFNGASGQDLLPVSGLRWYALRAVLRIDAGQLDLFIDGQKVLANAGFRERAADVARVAVGITGASVGTFHIDTVTAHAVPAPSVDYLVLDQFNEDAVGADPTDYQVAESGGDVAVVATPSEHDRGILLHKSAAGGEATAVRTFAPQTGTVTVQANVRTDEAAGTKVALYTQSSTGKAASSIQFNNGWLVYYVDGVAHRLGEAAPREWYTVRLILDVAAKRFEIFLDGRRMARSAPGRHVATRWTFRDPTVTDVGRLVFGVGEGSTGTVRVDNVMAFTNPVGRPPGTALDVRREPYRAVGDGITDDTAAIQRAIDDAPTGGFVLISGGVFLSGTIRLKSDMTLWIHHDAVLLGTQHDEGYPRFDTDGGGAPLIDGMLKKALILSTGADNVRIDGGGTIDGNGAKPEWGIDGGTNRPALMFLARGQNVSVRNLHVTNAATWAIVPVEIDQLLIADVTIDSNVFANRDGIDVTDSHDVLIERVSVWSDDDAICFKSYSAKGVNGVTVRLSTVGGSARANGVKFGTGSKGAFQNVVVEDVLIKHVDKGAITVTSVDGSVVNNLSFRRIVIDDALRAFFVLLGKRTQAASAPRWASGLRFEGIVGTRLAEPPMMSGQTLHGVTYKLYDVLISDVRLAVTGGVRTMPREPREYAGHYPESNLWTGPAKLPAYGYALQHVDGVTIQRSTTTVQHSDIRPFTALRDVTNANVG